MGNVPNKIREDFTLLHNPMKISSAKLLLVGTASRQLILAGVCLRGKGKAGTPANIYAEGGSSYINFTCGNVFCKTVIFKSGDSEHCPFVSYSFLYSYIRFNLILFCIPKYAFNSKFCLNLSRCTFMMPNSQYYIFTDRITLLHGAGGFLHLICACFIYTHIFLSNFDLQENKKEE